MSESSATPGYFSSAFSNIDAAADPRQFVHYMDDANAMEFFRAAKLRTYELLRLRAGDHVLDVGCGAGDDVRAMAQLVGPTGRAVGIDSSQTMIDAARERLGRGAPPADPPAVDAGAATSPDPADTVGSGRATPNSTAAAANVNAAQPNSNAPKPNSGAAGPNSAAATQSSAPRSAAAGPKSEAATPNSAAAGSNSDAGGPTSAAHIPGSAPIEFSVGDAEHLRFPDASFDGIRADRVLQHLSDPPRAIGEMVRTLRSGGRLVVFEPDTGGLLIDAPDIDVTRRITTFRGDAVRRGWIGRQLPRLFKVAALTDINVDILPSPRTDYAHTNASLRLDYYAQAAAEAGVVTPAEARAWSDALAAAAADGTFFCMVTMFMVSGRKP